MSSDSSTLPHFLVIGAQKSGTTTLYEDLKQHPSIGLSEKETSGLLSDDVVTPIGLKRYASEFRKVSEFALLGDVSTTYSMLPDHPGVAARAKSIRPDMRILYIVRNPIDRVISHHHHAYSLKQAGHDIDYAIQNDPQLVNYSSYGSQILPWIGEFGAGQVLVVRFEDYMDDRQRGFNEVLRFLGLPAHPLIDASVHNSSATKVVAVGGWRAVTRNPLYRRVLRPLLSESVRRRAMRRLLPSAPARPLGPSITTLRNLESLLTPEVALLSELTKTPALWNLGSTVDRFPRRA